MRSRTRAPNKYRRQRLTPKYQRPRLTQRAIALRLEELREKINANMPMLDELNADRAIKKRILGLAAKVNGLPAKQHCYDYLDAEIKYYKAAIEQFSLADEFYGLAMRSRKPMPISRAERHQPGLMVRTNTDMLRIYERLRDYLSDHSVFQFLKEYYVKSNRLNELAKTEFIFPATF